MGKQIDLIVTHYNEPWEIGLPFFRMLAMQRNANFDDIRVIIVQDGKEGALDWDNVLKEFTYDIKVITIEHGGISKARNAGIAASKAEWVMFCDFDDMFADVSSLSMILGVLPTDTADILWMDCYREQFMRGKDIFVNCLGDNFTYAYGKLFRRSFLNETGIRFPDLPFEMDYVFCALALSECESSRVMRITTKFTMYMKTVRRMSYTIQRKNISRMIESIFYGDMILVDEYEKRRNPDEKRTSVAKAILDTYFILNSTPKVSHAREIEELFIEFYRENKRLFETISQHELEVIVDAAEKHMCSILMGLYNNFLVEAGAPDTGMGSVRKWLRRLENRKTVEEETPYDSKNVSYENSGNISQIRTAYSNNKREEQEESDDDAEDDIRTEQIEQIDEPVNDVSVSANDDERVVVYCGTRNTYECILASLKSLVAHSRIDKAYLLIEDDEFPFELPDFATVVNVSNQSFFPSDGPNFNSTWTYMCLMRAAFPKLFPQHKKILSLDIDTIIVDDIEELWNMDLSQYYIAGVHEKDKQQSDYVNFGVIMMNLELLRNEEIDEQMIYTINHTKLKCPEQDAFNLACEGNILVIPSDFNFTPFTHLIATPEHERIIHYAGIQYWKGFSPAQKYLKLGWDEVYAMQNGSCEKDE